ncbi:hypothetical protein K2X30_03970 [bacterium]|nr:hypothetical protein [bacterium]
MKKKQKENLNRILIWVFFIVLGVLGFGPIHFGPDRPILNFETFFNKKFQPQYEAYFDSHLRKRSSLIQADTSLNFFLFNEVSTQTRIPVILGNKGSLFEKNYLNHYYGLGDQKGDIPKLGNQTLSKQIQSLKAAYDRVRSRKKNFVLIIYPHKVWITPEIVKDRWKLSPQLHHKAQAEQKEFFEALDATGIPWVNGVALFQQLQKEHPELKLYTRGGSHWTKTAACRVWQKAFRNSGYANSGKVPRLHCEEDQLHLVETNSDELDIARLSGVENVYGSQPFQERLPTLKATQKGPRVQASRLMKNPNFSV